LVGAHETRPGLSGVTRIAIDHARLCGASFYPVNPRYESVFGIACLASVSQLAQDIDVIVVLVGDPVGVVREAADAGVRVKFFVVFSNGFSEVDGDDGAGRERLLVREARRCGARVIGPNTNLNAWEPVSTDGPGIAVVSQSGMQGRMITQAQDIGIAVSHWAPTGNEADLDACDFMEYFAQDPGTAVICGYVEGFKSGEKLRRAALAALRHETPIVLVKVGRGEIGGAMARSHTGHLVGSDQVLSAFFDQFGIVRVDDFDQLVEVSAALTRCPVPEADGLAVCSVSGGAAAHVADLADDAGFDLPILGAETQRALRKLIPAGFRVDNPVDNGGTALFSGAGPDIWRACLMDPGVGLLLCPVPAPAPGTGDQPTLASAVVDTLIEVAASATKPILPVWSSISAQSADYQRLWDSGLPVFRNVRNALAAAAALLNHPARRPDLRSLADLPEQILYPPVQHHGTRVLDEYEAMSWLSGNGMSFAPHALCYDMETAVAVAEELGYPVVLKGRGQSHKTEHGLVLLNLHDLDAVRAGARELLRRSDGIIVAKQIADGIELLLGSTTDPVLGPVLALGAGGVTAEASQDVALATLPLTRGHAERMINSLRVSRVFDGWRGQPAIDRAAVGDAMMTMADIVASHPVVECEINPLLARADGVVGLDALVRLGES
jgi:acetate---CoA ligase (ADP-forming)